MKRKNGVIRWLGEALRVRKNRWDPAHLFFYGFFIQNLPGIHGEIYTKSVSSMCFLYRAPGDVHLACPLRIKGKGNTEKSVSPFLWVDSKKERFGYG